MKTPTIIVLALLCLGLFTESRVSGQPLIASKDAAVQSASYGLRGGALRQHFPSPVQLRSAEAPTDSALPGGVYTVGLGGRFPTIDSAFATVMRDGIRGNVTLTLIDTLYEASQGHHFFLGSVPGAGPSSRLTIRPAVGTLVTIRGEFDAVLYFQDIKYLTLDGRSDPPLPSAGITVHAQYSQNIAYNACVEAWGDADHNEFLHLNLKSDDARNISGSYPTGLGLYLTSSTPDSNLVEGNSVNAVFGIYVWGTASARPRHNTIRNNVVGSSTDSVLAWAIQSEFGEGTLIEGNVVQFVRNIYHHTGYNCTLSIGINAYADLNTVIRNNVVHSMYGSGGARLYAIGGSGDVPGATGDGLQIYNNMVYNLQNGSTVADGDGWIKGIFLSNNISTLIAYNTVCLSGTGANPLGVNALGLSLAGNVPEITIRNNILVNSYQQTAGARSTALYTGGTFTSDYNDLYVDTSFFNSYTTQQFRTLAAWQGTGNDQHSLSVLPMFRTPHVHLDSTSAASQQLDNKGVPIAGITTDFDGQLRNVSTPDIGADEYDFVVGVHEDLSKVPERFGLEQNYPNPFNPTTRIEFSVPRSTFVTLKVFNLLGQEIATLVNEKQSPGIYTVQFDGSKLASGVYFYRLQSGNFISVKKMVLLK
jgi:hypothetical protein